MEITSYPSLSRISLIAGPLKSSRSPLYPESLAVIMLRVSYYPPICDMHKLSVSSSFAFSLK